MTREERLESCRVCQNRKLDWNIGLVCKLTERVADFEGKCESFILDEEEKEYILARDLAAAGDNTVGDSADFEKNKKQGGLILSIGLLITAVSLLVANQLGFSIITTGTIIYGAIQYLKGVKQEKIYRDAVKKNSDD